MGIFIFETKNFYMRVTSQKNLVTVSKSEMLKKRTLCATEHKVWNQISKNIEDTKKKKKILFLDRE